MTLSIDRVVNWLIPSALIVASLIWATGDMAADDGYKVSRTSPSSITQSFAPGISLVGSVQTSAGGSSIGGGYSVTGGVSATVSESPHAFPIPALSSIALVILAGLLLIVTRSTASKAKTGLAQP